MDEFEELKHQLLSAIQYRDEIPQEVINMIEGIFKKIKEIYTENHCDSTSILEAIDVELNGVKSFLETRITDDRRNNQFEEMQWILGQIEQSIEEEQSVYGKIAEEDLEDLRNTNNNSHTKMFEEFGSDQTTIGKTVNNILGRVEEILEDINLLQRRSLSARRVKDEEIEEISFAVKYAFRNFTNQGDQMIAFFVEDDKQFRGIILEKYMEYMQAAKESREKASSAMPEEGISPQQAFRDSLDAGIPLDEQAEDAETFLTRRDDDDKLSKLLDEIPESTL